MKNLCYQLLVILLLPIPAASQPADDSVSALRFRPPGLLFAPLKAGSEEARLGLVKFLDASEMAVEIGGAGEILGLELPASGMKFALGIEFFGKGFITGAEGLRLQVDALDGYFGGHLSGSLETGGTGGGEFQARLRILHRSAHLVDGHYDAVRGGWIDGRTPLPFTRDYGELTVGELLPNPAGSLRFYAGFSYATLARPTNIERMAYSGGLEITLDRLTGSILANPSQLYGAYHLALDGAPVYAASNRVQAGMKIGPWTGRGLDIYLMYYDGRQFFGEYFDLRLTTLGAGFMVDF